MIYTKNPNIKIFTSDQATALYYVTDNHQPNTIPLPKGDIIGIIWISENLNDGEEPNQVKYYVGDGETPIMGLTALNITSLTELSDVEINDETLQNHDILAYNAEQEYFENTNKLVLEDKENKDMKFTMDFAPDTSYPTFSIMSDSSAVFIFADDNYSNIELGSEQGYSSLDNGSLYLEGTVTTENTELNNYVHLTTIDKEYPYLELSNDLESDLSNSYLSSKEFQIYDKETNIANFIYLEKNTDNQYQIRIASPRNNAQDNEYNSFLKSNELIFNNLKTSHVPTQSILTSEQLKFDSSNNSITQNLITTSTKIEITDNSYKNSINANSIKLSHTDTGGTTSLTQILNGQIMGITTITNDNDAINKAYVDAFKLKVPETTELIDGYVLTWKDSEQKFVSSDVPSKVKNLNDLEDIELDDIETNQVLAYNGTNWVNAASGVTPTSIENAVNAYLSDPSHTIYSGGTGITITGREISLNTASATSLGGVKIGNYMTITDGKISVNICDNYNTYGIVKINSNSPFKFTSGELDFNFDNNSFKQDTSSHSLQLKPASTSTIGGIMIDTNSHLVLNDNKLVIASGYGLITESDQTKLTNQFSQAVEMRITFSDDESHPKTYKFQVESSEPT